jgi:xanthine dehydrogenase molybdopterin-binding subunit B
VKRIVGAARASAAKRPDKLCGLAKYVDDYALPGCLFGATLRSTIACGRIRSLTLDPAFPWSEYVVVTADDIPGHNHVALIENDQPLLATDRVRHPMEPILLVAHPVRAKAYAALAHVKVEYEEEAPLLDAEQSTTVFKSFAIERGDAASGLAGADVVVEGEYRVPHQEQAYIETNGRRRGGGRDARARSARCSVPTTSSRRSRPRSGCPKRRCV